MLVGEDDGIDGGRYEEKRRQTLPGLHALSHRNQGPEPMNQLSIRCKQHSAGRDIIHSYSSYS